MKRKNEKGFALVLSLLLLLVMSLMGGALIVISSTDHQSNNSSDEYQQTFYVAETALLEGEKFIVNQMMGPWVAVSKVVEEKPVGLSDDESADWDLMAAEMTARQEQGMARYTDQRDLPTNRKIATDTPCFNSYRNIVKTNVVLEDVNYPNTLAVAAHEVNKNFGYLIKSVFGDVAIDTLADTDTINREKAHMDRFRYEYFIVNIGSANFRGAGSSLKKTTTNTQSSGSAYKIYGCGYMMSKDEAKDASSIGEGFSTEGWAAITGKKPDILVALETVVVLSN
tara:strand:- start:22 stop:867 length:846 start_codon:yes stop_codon:yes gene_type:complete